MNKFRIFLFYSGLVDIKAREGHDAVEGVSMEFLFYGEHGEQVEPTVSADGISGTRRLQLTNFTRFHMFQAFTTALSKCRLGLTVNQY